MKTRRSLLCHPFSLKHQYFVFCSMQSQNNKIETRILINFIFAIDREEYENLFRKYYYLLIACYPEKFYLINAKSKVHIFIDHHISIRVDTFVSISN